MKNLQPLNFDHVLLRSVKQVDSSLSKESWKVKNPVAFHDFPLVNIYVQMKSVAKLDRRIGWLFT